MKTTLYAISTLIALLLLAGIDPLTNQTNIGSNFTPSVPDQEYVKLLDSCVSCSRNLNQTNLETHMLQAEIKHTKDLFTHQNHD